MFLLILDVRKAFVPMWGLFFSPKIEQMWWIYRHFINILSFETRKIRQKLTNWASQRVILELLELFGSSWGRLQLGRTFIFKNERFASTGARFLRFSLKACFCNCHAFWLQKTCPKPFQNKVQTFQKSNLKTTCFLTSMFWGLGLDFGIHGPPNWS